MSKLNEIEQKLSEIDATEFHKLVDTYLNKKYKYTIHSTGTKTKIETFKIDKIILACNVSLLTVDIEMLKQKCAPIISKDFLGIEVDTGQILDEDDFVKVYDSSKYRVKARI